MIHMPCHVMPCCARMKVPTTFNEMVLFNASVMGFGANTCTLLACLLA